MNNELWQARKWIASEVKGGTEYTDTVVADALAEGHKAEMTANWRKNFLLQCVECGFISYEKALHLDAEYARVIASYK